MLRKAPCSLPGSPGPPAAPPSGASWPTAPAPGRKRPCGRFLAHSRPGAIIALRATAAALGVRNRGVLPCAPPVPAAPAGGSGEAQGQFGGLRPPTPFMAWAPPGVRWGSAFRCQPGGLPL